MDEQELAWMEASHAGCTSDTCDAVALLAEVRRLQAECGRIARERDRVQAHLAWLARHNA